MPVAAPSAAREVPSHAEPLTELEQRYLTAIDHQFRSLQRIVSLRGEAGEGATAGPACSQAGHEVLLQRLERRLELWGSRLGQERYRRNFPRMLRDLQARLRRLEAEVAAPAPAVVEAPRAEGQTLPDSDSAERVCKRGSPPAVPTPPPDGVTQLAPANDDCAAAAILVAGTVSGETLTATTDGSTTCGGSGPDVWFRYVAVADGLVQFDTVGSDYDTVLSLHSGCPGTTDNQLECNDDWFGLQSRVVHAMTVGQEVLVRVGGCCGGDTGNFQLNAGAVGGISGTVSDASTGLPLDGVDMRLSDALGYWVMGDQTNGDGAYEFPGVGAGTYYVSTRYTEDYVDELYDDFVCQPGCDEELGTPIIVVAGETTGGIDLELRRGGRIVGEVTGEPDGRPLGGSRLELYGESGDWVDSTTANPAGEYRFDGLAPGIYFVRTDNYSSDYLDELYDDIPCPGWCDPTLGTPIVVDYETISHADLSLSLGGSISGQVTAAASGRPLDGALATVYDDAGGYVEDGYASSSGTYVVRGLQGGTYFVQVERSDYLSELYDDVPCPGYCDPLGGTPVAVSIGTDTTGVDFELDREGAFTGTVVEAAGGEPISGAEVDAWNSAGEWLGYGGQVDPAGVYSVTGLAAGTYFATTQNDDGYLDELYDDLPCAFGLCLVGGGTPIAVATGLTTEGINFVLDTGGAIAGTVSDIVTGDGLDVELRVWTPGPGDVATADTDGFGGYFVSGLPTGSYTIRTSGWSGWTDELYDDIPCEWGCEPAVGTPVAVTSGATTSAIDFALCGRPHLSVSFPPSADPDSWIDGCFVRINGVAAPAAAGCPAIDRIEWEWGDDSGGSGAFPAEHTYARGVTLPVVRVSAVDIYGHTTWVDAELNVWDCLPPGTCGHPEGRALIGLTFDHTATVQACTQISVGPDFHLVQPGDLTLAAGEVIEFRNGVTIHDQCRLAVSHTLTPPP
jgi:hypothetical protein